MTDKKARALRLGYKIFFSVLTAVVAALFIMQVCRIYFGIGSFTRALVLEYLGQISIPFWLWIAAIFIGFVIWEIVPEDGKKKYGQDVRYSLYRLKKKLPVQAEGELLKDAAEVARYERILRIVWGVCAAVCVVFSIVGLAYLLNFDNFPAQNLIPEMVDAVIHVFPFVACAFALCIGASVYSGYIEKRELPHIKRLAALGKATSPEYSKFERAYYKAVAVIQSDIFTWTMRAALLILGVTFVIIGVYNGGATDVLNKAINICTECIGLG